MKRLRIPQASHIPHTHNNEDSRRPSDNVPRFPLKRQEDYHQQHCCLSAAGVLMAHSPRPSHFHDVIVSFDRKELCKVSQRKMFGSSPTYSSSSSTSSSSKNLLSQTVPASYISAASLPHSTCPLLPSSCSSSALEKPHWQMFTITSKGEGVSRAQSIYGSV